MQAIIDRVQADFVSGPNRLPPFDSAASHPHGEAGWIMVAAITFFGHWRPAKLAAPDDQSLIQKAARL